MGRDALLKNYWAWMTNGQPVSIRGLTGPAGRGKTRFALELCRDAAEVNDWTAGFATSSELSRFSAQANAADWGWSMPALVVVDYAAGSAKALRHWLDELADNPQLSDPETGAKRPLRILLMDRSIDPDQAWWADLFCRRDGPGTMVAAMLDRPEPQALPAIQEAANQRAIMNAVLDQAGADLRVPEEGQDPAWDRALDPAQTAWAGDPLFLMMAALLAKEKDIAQVFALSRQDLAFELAARERSRIARIAEERTGSHAQARLLCHLAAAVTLLDGVDRARLPALIEHEAQATGHALPEGWAPVMALLSEIMAPRGDGADALRPDMLGEAHPLTLLGDRGASTQDAAVARIAAHAPAQAGRVLIRACQNYAPAGREEPLRWLEAVFQDREIGSADDVLVLIEVANSLPADTLALRAFAARMFATIVQIARAQGAGPADHPRTPVLAVGLNNLAHRFSALGRREEALAAAEEAVTLRRALAAARPDAFTPALATSLSVLGDQHAGLAHWQAALDAYAEAAQRLTPYMARLPQAFGGLYVQNMRDLIRAMIAAGRDPAAIDATIQDLNPPMDALRAAGFFNQEGEA